MDWTETLELTNRMAITAHGLRFAILYKDLDTLNKIVWNLQTDLDILQENIDDEICDREG